MHVRTTSFLRRAAGGVAAAALAFTLTGCDDLLLDEGTRPSTATPSPGTGVPAESGPPSAGTALDALDDVEVKGRAPRTGYDRDLFGAGWGDPDRNGCDTRNDVLARDLTGETFREGTRDCVVLTGTLADPYSGTTIAFRRGQDTSDEVQIDHVVAVSDAWQKGAQQWDAATRVAFYNDPLNLLAVDGALNQQKSDGDAATWLPPESAYRCAYVARQVAVKLTYRLWMTQAEHDAVAGILGHCPDEPLPAREDAPEDVAVPAAAWVDCADVRDAGAAPLHRGQPGWHDGLDRDGDGVACE